VIQETQHIMKELFGDALLPPTQPTLDELYAYALAAANSEDLAARFPVVHAYLQAVEGQDAHYQAVLAVLKLERAGQLVPPPIPARFDFSYLAPPSTGQPWRVTLGQLIVTLTEQWVAGFTPTSTPQLAYRKSVDEQTLLELKLTEETSGVKVNITARATATAAATCTLMVEVAPPNRHWPQLSGIPIALTTEPSVTATQMTDAFGKTIFRAVTTARLPSATIAVGPLAELSNNQP